MEVIYGLVGGHLLSLQHLTPTIFLIMSTKIKYWPYLHAFLEELNSGPFLTVVSSSRFHKESALKAGSFANDTKSKYCPERELL